MRLLFILIAHLLVTLARLAGPGGVRAVAAESLAVKHQLLIMKRSQRRSPNLTAWDRVILGFCTLLVSPRRLGKISVILKTSTLLRLHRALVKRKYRLLYSSRPCGRELLSASNFAESSEKNTAFFKSSRRRRSFGQSSPCGLGSYRQYSKMNCSCTLGRLVLVGKIKPLSNAVRSAPTHLSLDKDA